MAFKNNEQVINEQEKNSRTYLKCLIEGMHEWLEIKEKAGYNEIKLIKPKIEKEIDINVKKITLPVEFPKIVIEKMKNLGMNKELLREFKGVFI